MMQLRWERGDYLASVIIQISEHVHDITNLQTPIGEIFSCLHSSSVGGRVAGTTLRAVDEETVGLVVLGVQQDRPTVSAYIVNCVRAGDENGRCMWIFHDRLSSSVRAHIRVYGKGPAPAKAERGNFQV
jgi:hypothetical protein